MKRAKKTSDPVAHNKRVQEAQEILKQLGFPAKQYNVRSALVLLALLDLKQKRVWKDAQNPMLGINDMMEWFAKEYHKYYAPNSRENVRRQTIHQFLEAGLIVQNPDKPDRPVNSAKNVYQVIPEALKLLRSFGSENWEKNLDDYLRKKISLKEQYAQARQMKRIPVLLSDNTKLFLSPGGQNILVKRIIDEFFPRFLPNQYCGQFSRSNGEKK